MWGGGPAREHRNAGRRGAGKRAGRMMSRRAVSLILNVVLVICGALLGLGANYATNGGPSIIAIPDWVKRWALPISGVTLLVVLTARIWLFLVEHPRQKTSWSSGRSPFPGLEAFTEEEADVFFGRERETQQLIDRLSPTLPRDANRFVAVIGPSGVGKSSVLHAGVLPRLQDRPSRWAAVPPFVPETEPTRNLARSLAAALDGADADSVHAELLADPRALARNAERIRQRRPRGTRFTLLIIDQAEELVTLCGESECKSFLNLLDQGLRDDPKLWILCALRSDFLTAFLDRGFAQLFKNPVVIGALDRQALFEVIEKPAERAGLTFAPGVVGRLVDDTGSGDAMPLLACTLRALYETRGANGMVTADDYVRVGGVAGTLARQADKVAAELAAAYPGVSVTDVLTNFVALDGDQPMRRRVAEENLSPTERHVVDAFTAARLLHSVGDGAGRRLEVVHEAIFRQWAPLREAIFARSDDLRQRAELERAAEDWNDSGRLDSYLLRGDRLRRALAWTARDAPVGGESPTLHEFLQRSAFSDHEARKQLSEAVARYALGLADRDAEQSVLLVLAAVDECGHTPLAHRALLAALERLRTKAILRGHKDAVRGVAWSPDGQRIATCSHDRTLRIWRVDGTGVRSIRGHSDWMRAVAWAPDGRRVVTASNDHTAMIWDAGSGDQLARLAGHKDVVHAVAWAPSGSHLATGSHDHTAKVWDAETSRALVTLRGHESWVRSVAWSGDGQRLATGSSDGTIRIWDAASGAHLRTIAGHDDWVHCVAWSPDGRLIASASSDETVRVWHAEDSEVAPLVLRGHHDWVHRVAWSPDGESLATASRDRTVRIWDSESGAELAALHGHADWVHDLSWSPDGSMIATASYDKTARVWEAHAAARERLLHHDGKVQGIGWSPDSTRLATASHDQTARVWSVDGTLLGTLRGHTGWVHDVSWSTPDQDRLATASRDMCVIIWDSRRYVEAAVLRGHDNWVEALMWSPDGRRIATASNDRTARIWDAGTFSCLTEIKGHAGWVRAVAWSPSMQFVATASTDHTCCVWRSDTGKKILVLRGHDDSVEDVAWAPDGLRIATASHDRTARIWDARDGSAVVVLRGHEDWVMGISWSPDGRLIATASNDHTARIWDADSGSELAVLVVHEDTVEDIAWSPDGRWIATASRDGTAQILDAVPQFGALLAEARARVFRELTPDERRAAMLPDKPA